MLIYKRTSLLEARTQTIVNTVNCVGVMGKGLAKEFKRREPDMFKAYKEVCEKRLLAPGRLWLWRGSESWILNFPTKLHWRNPSRIEWVEAGLVKFVETYRSQGITEISFPKLGCGNGNLEWSDVRPLMERHLSNLDIPVFIHDYTEDIGLPEHLEEASQSLREKLSHDLSFPSFLKALKCIANDNPALTTSDNVVFKLNFEGDQLKISRDTAEYILEEDDLRGVWISLMNGLVTTEKAGWTAVEAGAPMLTLLRVLPQVRTVQIQRHDRDRPELAVELIAEALPSAESGKSVQQLNLSWH